MGPIVISHFFIKLVRVHSRRKKFQRDIAQYLTLRQKQIDEVRKQVSQVKIREDLVQEVINADVLKLKQMLEAKKVTSEQLLIIFTQRTLEHGVQNNWITDLNFQHALRKARQRDQLRATSPEKCTGELFGIVMSVKDTIDLKGFPSTVGCASRLKHIPNEDGQCAQVLDNAGAILFVKSNVPQIAMTFNSHNFIYGRAQNPWNPKRVVGGSSGGEAALVGARCSALGIGSDIGGSVRIPAAYCACTSLKPTSSRLSFKGHTVYNDYFEGQLGIQAVLGPIGKNVDDCAVFMRSFLNSKNYENLTHSQRDPYFQPKPFNEEAFKDNRKLRIGYFLSDEQFMPASVAQQRGVQIAVDILKSNGHELVPITIDHFKEIIGIFFQVFTADGNKAMDDLLQGEKPIPSYNSIILNTYAPTFLKHLASKLLKLFGKQRIAFVLDNSDELKAKDDRKLSNTINRLRSEFYYQMRTQFKVEAIVCPSFGCPPNLPELQDLLDTCACYTFLWNTYNLPAGIVPVTVIREDEQKYEDLPGNRAFNDLIYKTMVRNMKDSAGLPITVQVVGLPLQEELCLNIMRQIEQKAEFRQKHPFPI